MKKRICVVMGVANEAGLHLASEYAEDGFHMILAGKQDQQLNHYQQVLQRVAPQVKTYFINTSDQNHLSEVENLFQQIRREKGEVTALIYNESIYHRDFNGHRGGKNPFQDVRLNNSRLLTAINQVLPGMRRYRTGAIHLTGTEFNQETPNAQLEEASRFSRELAYNLSRELDPYGIKVWQDGPYGPQQVPGFGMNQLYNRNNQNNTPWSNQWNNRQSNGMGYTPWNSPWEHQQGPNQAWKNDYSSFGPSPRYFDHRSSMDTNRFGNYRGNQGYFSNRPYGNQPFGYQHDRSRAYPAERNYSRYELSPQGELMEEDFAYNGQA